MARLDHSNNQQRWLPTGTYIHAALWR